MDIRVKQIRQILDALARADRNDNDTKEIIYDRELQKIREMDRDGIIDIVKEAVGDNGTRKRFASFVFSELFDVAGIEEVFSDLLASADETARSNIIQTIGLREMRNLVGVLNRHFYRETDDFCKGNILSALGRIADASSLPIFVELMQNNAREHEWYILVASTNFASPEFKNYLFSIFEDREAKMSHKVMAAWGLAKLGQKHAYDYLVLMLDDPEVGTANSYDPGHSIRAAQAIGNINGWDFRWDRVSVAIIKSRVNGNG